MWAIVSSCAISSKRTNIKSMHLLLSFILFYNFIVYWCYSNTENVFLFGCMRCDWPTDCCIRISSVLSICYFCAMHVFVLFASIVWCLDWDRPMFSVDPYEGSTTNQDIHFLVSTESIQSKLNYVFTYFHLTSQRLRSVVYMLCMHFFTHFDVFTFYINVTSAHIIY